MPNTPSKDHALGAAPAATDKLKVPKISKAQRKLEKQQAIALAKAQVRTLKAAIVASEATPPPAAMGAGGGGESGGRKTPDSKMPSGQLSAAERILVALNCVTLICLIFQSWTMKGQLQQMVEGSAQTEAIIGEARKAADSMAETLKYSKAALDATIAANQLDQRAWVTVKFGSIVVLPKQPIRFEAKLQNLGKTPALECWYSLSVFGSDPDTTDAENIRRFEKEIDESKEPKATIFPQSEFILVPPNVLVGDDLIKAIPSGKYRITIIGRVRYKDVFGRAHTTKFHYLYNPAVMGGLALPDYNVAD